MASSTDTRFSTVPTDDRVIQTNELVTGPPGVEMLKQCGLSNSNSGKPLDVMDNASGGGIITAEILKLEGGNNIKRIVAADIDDKMVFYVNKQIKSLDWTSVETLKADQQSVPLDGNTFTHIFNNFGVFFCANNAAVLSETYRLLRPHGIAGFTSWKKITWWTEVAIPALSTFLPESPALPGDVTKAVPAPAWSDPAAIPERLEKAGFKDVQVSEYAFTPDVGPEEFAEATSVLVKAITGRVWSVEDNKKYDDQIQPALLRYLEENFPDGKWNGQMVAIISTGRKD